MTEHKSSLDVSLEGCCTIADLCEQLAAVGPHAVCKMVGDPLFMKVTPAQPREDRSREYVDSNKFLYSSTTANDPEWNAISLTKPKGCDGKRCDQTARALMKKLKPLAEIKPTALVFKRSVDDLWAVKSKPIEIHFKTGYKKAVRAPRASQK